ncbi:MAG TPA: hypothetical protein VFH39_02485 [Candidatus Saccharimonadales bacterium]|nr:hypothetical protein [Candidatus Saccharimonadales bacterium]
MLEGMGIMGLGEATSNPAAVSVALAVGAVAAGGGILLIGRGAEQIEQFGSAEPSPNDEMDVSEGQGDVE